MIIQARDYQQDIITQVKASIMAGKKRPLVVSPTGSGKTVIFSIIADGAAKKRKRVMILVHRTELLDQTSRTLRDLGLAHGLIAADRSADASQMIQVAKVGTLVRRLERTQPPDVIIVDEAHHATAGSWEKIIAAYPSAVVLGVTATPQRLDGKGLGDVFDDLILGPSVADLIQRGFLCPPVYYAPPSLVDRQAIKVQSNGEYDQSAVASAMDKPTITGDAVDHYRRICPGAPAVAFCASVKHAEHVAEAFRDAGFRASSIDGTLPPAERRSRVRSLADGRLHVLTSCDIISEGFDIPMMVAAILLRPTQSLGLHLQQIGRPLRIALDKPRAIILDHVGNCIRHGLAEDAREWSLEGRKKRSKGDSEPSIPVRQCPQCYCCHPPSPSCPQCNHEYIIKTREIEQEEGMLTLLGGVVDEKHRQCPGCNHVHSRWDHACPKCGTQTGAPSKKAEQAKAQTFEELLAIGKQRGYKAPALWAKYVWRGRQQQRDRVFI